MQSLALKEMAKGVIRNVKMESKQKDFFANSSTPNELKAINAFAFSMSITTATNVLLFVIAI